jgi:cell division protein ZapE
MSLISLYDDAVARGERYDNPQQRAVLAILQNLATDIERHRHFWFRRRRKKPHEGFYLYGPVGAGKTFLMDLFYQSIQTHHKRRLHFHQFMQQVDGQLRRLQGTPDPLKSIAVKFAKTTRLLCLDEFFVQDIATAMILVELLQYLLAEGVIFVMTSNTAPKNLYLNGLQRARFLPAIALIQESCVEINLTVACDYRLGRPPLAKAYLYPLNADTAAAMLSQFNTLEKDALEKLTLTVQGREIPTIKCSETVAWFDFNVICTLGRSQLDYLEIAERFHTVFVSNVPVMSLLDTVGALLLTNFIDVMYDRKVRVVISAAAPIESLYKKGEVLAEFARTQSRLQEMQSIDYPRKSS